MKWFQKKTENRRVNRFDLPLEMGVIVPQEFRYKNELESFARYLELKLRFYEWEHDSELRSRLKERAREYNSTTYYDEWKERKEREKLNPPELTTSSTIGIGYASEAEEEDAARRTTKIPSCQFFCGTCPCGCNRDYQEYESMAVKYEGWYLDDRNVNNRYSVKDIIEEIDKGKDFLPIGSMQHTQQ